MAAFSLALALATGVRAEDKQETRDGVRVRGGFDIGGGVFIAPKLPDTIGGNIRLQGRVGVQINHYFGVFYQVQPGVGLIKSADSYVATGFIYNSILADLTLAHFFEIGVGPSVDALFSAGVDFAGGSAGTGSVVRPGIDTKVAFNIGGLSGNGPRRSGFHIDFGFHPVFLEGAVLMSLTAGLGGEWY
jgi:hypothetical protein